MDRVPLESVVDKPEPQVVEQPQPTTPQGPTDINDNTRVTGNTIDIFKTKADISSFLGFEDSHFEGMGKEGDLVYKWAAELSREIGEEPLSIVASLLRDTGYTERGKPLIKKLALWIALDVESRKAREKRNKLT